MAETGRQGKGKRNGNARGAASRERASARERTERERSRESGSAPTKGESSRTPKTRTGRMFRKVRRGWRRLLEIPVVWVALLLIAGTWALTPGGFFPGRSVAEAGVATRDYVAPRDLLIPDEETTAQKQRRAREDVPPVYDFDPAAADELERKLATLFQAGRGATVEAATGAAGVPEEEEHSGPWAPAELAEALGQASSLSIGPAQVEALQTARFAEDLEDRVRRLAARALRRGIVEGKTRLLENRVRGVTLRNLESATEQLHFDLYDHLEYPGEVREFLEAEVGDWRDLTSPQRRAVVDLLLSNLPANLSPNRKETLERQEDAEESTAPVYKQIRKGQVIARKGDQVDQSTRRLIAEVSGGRRPTDRLLPLLATLALLGLAAGALWPGLAHERVADHSRRRLYSEALLLLVVSLLLTKLSFSIATALAASFEVAPFSSVRSYVYGVPFAGLALVSALLLGRTTATLLVFGFSILVSRLAGAEALWVTIYAAVGSLGAAYAVDAYQVKQRLTLTRVGLFVGGLNVLTVLILTALSTSTSPEPLQLAFDALCALAGGLLVAAAGSFTLPILESILGITTDIKLVELANANLPVLRRLAFEAPGTFQHSLMVANLAKEGCDVIGADSVLAYTGGLYHDIGKVFRPEYFVENQRPGHNPHDKLEPTMSALIIISHVKDGLALAEEHHLPPPVLDAIAQHHGTRRINYFFNRAKERAEREDDVTEERYRYPGPKPQNRVQGVLMLADGVEAASRTLSEPTPLRIRTLVRKIVDDCLEDGQLDDSDLTLSDIKRVSDAFIRVLTTIFHQRIDYPGFDFSGERPERPVRAVRAS